jgi:hypothetical protein
MRYAILIVLCSLVFVGCSESPRPLDSGVAVSGTVWKRSLHATVGENTGAPIPQDARVDVFESLIIIRHADGSRQVVPLDYVSDLKLK